MAFMPTPAVEGFLTSPEAVLSPESFFTIEEYAANPRFLELTAELRSALFLGAEGNEGTPATSSEHGVGKEPQYRGTYPGPSITFKSIVSSMKRVEYLKVWTLECAPWLDMFDSARHFGIQVPVIAQTSPALMYAILALSARQIERQNGLKDALESLELYQESIKHLHPLLEARDPKALVTSCILCCLEMMSVSPRDWRRHVEGCAALFSSFRVHGFSGGLLQAVFWCFARMDLCGAIISDGAKSTVLPLEKWVEVPETASRRIVSGIPVEDVISDSFVEKGRAVPDMHANYAVYLCAKTCDLVSAHACRLELGESQDGSGDFFHNRWARLWEEIQKWELLRPDELIPVKSSAEGRGGSEFPEILFAHWAAISSTQLHHSSCIMMLEIKPRSIVLEPGYTHNSALWHAKRVVGISMTNPHRGCLNNAIQPLFVAGRLFSHRREQVAIINLIKRIEETTGWGARWRIKDLEDAWGYDGNHNG